jgi:hypothetical protein
MNPVTHTQAGLLAAGVARHGASIGAVGETATLLATALPQGAQATGAAVYGHHQSATWTQGAIAKPATFMVFDRKNRPTRPLSECSP